MIASTRGIARKSNLQWRLATSSSSARPPLRQAGKAPPSVSKDAAAEARVVRPYKPTFSSKNSNSKSKSNTSTQTPPPLPPPPKPNTTLLDHWRSAWLPLSGAALLAGFLGFYVFGTAAASLKQSENSPCGPCEHSSPTGRPPALTGDNAEKFDKELNLPEWWMGVTSLRSRLAREAKGHVLEVAMGSGRNLEYYNWDALSAAAEAAQTGQRKRKLVRRGDGISSFTGLDISVDMLDVSRKKLILSVPPMSSSAPIVKASSMADHSGGQLSFLDGHLRLINADAHHPLPLPSRAEKYDTITQSFGLCSVSDPVAVLSNLAAVLRPDTGRILLLEHGKGWYGIVNGLLDKNADKHFAKYGCWWNRDIEAIVEEAAKKTPGLKVVKVERPNITQMGTLVWVELRLVTDKPRIG